MQWMKIVKIYNFFKNYLFPFTFPWQIQQEKLRFIHVFSCSLLPFEIQTDCPNTPGGRHMAKAREDIALP